MSNTRALNASRECGSVTAAFPWPRRSVACKGTMPSGAGRKTGCASERLARRNHLESAAHFTGDRFLLRKVPLPQRGQAIGAHAGLREARNLLRERDGMRTGFALADKAIGESHAVRLMRAAVKPSR